MALIYFATRCTAQLKGNVTLKDSLHANQVCINIVLEQTINVVFGDYH